MRLRLVRASVAAVVAWLLWLGVAPSRAKGVEDLAGLEKIVFEDAVTPPLQIYVVRPAHPPAEKAPGLLLFFGGGWDHGDPSQFLPQARYFAARGMVVFLPEYRTRQSHGTTPVECVADGKAALRWVRLHAESLGVDANRLAAGGGSAGGHVAASTAVLTELEADGADRRVSCRPDALVLFNPVLDTTPRGYGAAKLGERARELSPVDHVAAGLPPTVIFHGRADVTAPFENSERFTAAVQKAGGSCTLHGFDGQRHGFYRTEPFASATLRAADEFFVALGWLPPPPPQP